MEVEQRVWRGRKDIVFKHEGLWEYEGRVLICFGQSSTYHKFLNRGKKGVFVRDGSHSKKIAVILFWRAYTITT